MGAVGSKSHLERRNTALRRSQRKSIHGVKSKADKIVKDIRKYKGVEEDTDYVELKARIEATERELSHFKNLQPEVRAIHGETLKKTEGLHALLEAKLAENRDKAREKALKEQEKEKANDKGDDDDDDDVFVEEVTERDKEAAGSAEKRETVAVRVIQVEPIEGSPQINKRLSAMKIGVPVMPLTMMESLHLKQRQQSDAKNEEQIKRIREELEPLEEQISTFVGTRNGKHYNNIKSRLDGYRSTLTSIASGDEAIVEQVKMCNNYISSCLSFLDEKAVVGNENDDGNVVSNTPDDVNSNRLSPRSVRTTFI